MTLKQKMVSILIDVCIAIDESSFYNYIEDMGYVWEENCRSYLQENG